MSLDSIADFLTILRNNIMISKPSVETSFSTMRYAIAQILLNEGFIRDVQIKQDGNFKKLYITLKYVNGESVIHEIKRESKPSRRQYARSKGIKPVIGGLGLSILTTSKGVVSHKKAEQLGVGGEVICTVW